MVSKKEIRDYFARFGRKGGKARLDKMTPEHRQAVARNAAKARWSKQKESKKGSH